MYLDVFHSMYVWVGLKYFSLILKILCGAVGCWNKSTCFTTGLFLAIETLKLLCIPFIFHEIPKTIPLVHKKVVPWIAARCKISSSLPKLLVTRATESLMGISIRPVWETHKMLVSSSLSHTLSACKCIDRHARAQDCKECSSFSVTCWVTWLPEYQRSTVTRFFLQTGFIGVWRHTSEEPVHVRRKRRDVQGLPVCVMEQEVKLYTTGAWHAHGSKVSFISNKEETSNLSSNHSNSTTMTGSPCHYEEVTWD